MRDHTDAPAAPIESWGIGVLGMILVCGIALRAFLLVGYYGGDDREYYPSAVELSGGAFTPVGEHWQARLGVIGPMAGLMRWQGPSMVAATLPMLIASVIALVLTYLLARRFTQRSDVACLATAIVALYPLDVLMATSVFPGAGIAALTAVSIYAFVRGEESVFGSRKRDSEKVVTNSERSWLPLAWYLLAGLAMGLAYTFRITSLFAMLPYAAWVVAFRRRIVFGDIVFATGLLAILGCEALAFSSLGQSASYRFDVLFGNASGTSSGPTEAIRPGGFLFSPLVALVTNQELGLLPVYAFFAIALSLAYRRRAVWPLVLFLVLTGSYTLWGTVRLGEYRPLRPWPRYLTALTVPTAIVVADAIMHLRGTRRRWLVIGLLMLSFVGGLALDDSWATRRIGESLNRLIADQTDQEFVLPDREFMAATITNGFRVPPRTRLLRVNEYHRSERLVETPEIVADDIARDLKILTSELLDELPPGFQADQKVTVPRNRLSRIMEGILGPDLSPLSRLRSPTVITVYSYLSDAPPEEPEQTSSGENADNAVPQTD